MKTETTKQLLKLLVDERKNHQNIPAANTPERRMLLNALEVAIVISESTDRKDEMPESER